MPTKKLPLIPRLSKTKYLAGLQCHKRLHLEIHQPELKETDDQTQTIFDLGAEIGALARRLFPGGTLVEHDHEHLSEAIAQTAELLKDRNIPAIFEGTFQFDHVLVRVDILKRVGKGNWRLIEVKATADVKPEHYDDVAIQTYVLKGAGIPLAGSSLMHINTGYVYQGGELDLAKFFIEESVTKEVAKRLPDVPGRLAKMREMLKTSTPPAIEPGGHCGKPYPCGFWNHCTKDKPARWTFHLPYIGRKFEQLRAIGIEAIEDIPDDFPLTPQQRRIKDAREWIGPTLKKALRTIRYPVHHVDFETLWLAIPRYAGTKPYQQIPFQWSNHTEQRDGSVRHESYLCQDHRDPREEFLVTLLKSVGKTGSICVYNAAFEATRLRELKEAFPKLTRELDGVLARIWDLRPVIMQCYYHPGFEGSTSLKNVLPALVPALDYVSLAIQEGEQAAYAYYRMIYGGLEPEEAKRLREALLAYCGRDTQALLEIRRVLWAKAHA
jgi:hypothetical protein